MSEHERFEFRRARTTAMSVDAAVGELTAQLEGADLAGVFVFVAGPWDHDRLGPALTSAFACPTVGATTAGLVGPDGYTATGIVAAGFYGATVDFAVSAVSPLSQCHQAVAAAAADLQNRLDRRPLHHQAFATILVDGLSMVEERMAAALYQSLGNVPIVGGSAGDELTFTDTRVLVDGEFRRGAAAVVAVSGPFACRVMRAQHFQPSERVVVVTSASPERRIIHELDGESALVRYCEVIGIPQSELAPSDYSSHPLLLKLADSHYVRSIKRPLADGSLELLCAIDEGLVLRIGVGQDPVANLVRSLEEAKRELGTDHLLGGLCFDCILRRLEFDASGSSAAIGGILDQAGLLGFSTYGEQVGGVHVNQTMTGVAFASQ
jgi:hypothetical protein